MSAATVRGPLRLSLGTAGRRDHLQGGWWPQSRVLGVELADLVDHLPSARGRVIRALFSRPDWDDLPRRVTVSGRLLRVGSFPGDDTHEVQLRMADHSVLRLLVVPPAFSAPQGAEAMLAAATPGNTHSATELLATVTDSPDVDPDDQWASDGGTASVPARRPYLIS